MVPSELIQIDSGRVYTACWIEPIRSGSIQEPSVNGLLLKYIVMKSLMIAIWNIGWCIDDTKVTRNLSIHTTERACRSEGEDTIDAGMELLIANKAPPPREGLSQPSVSYSNYLIRRRVD